MQGSAHRFNFAIYFQHFCVIINISHWNDKANPGHADQLEVITTNAAHVPETATSMCKTNNF